MFDKSTLFAEEISKKSQKEISHQAERNLQLPQAGISRSNLYHALSHSIPNKYLHRTTMHDTVGGLP